MLALPDALGAAAWSYLRPGPPRVSESLAVFEEIERRSGASFSRWRFLADSAPGVRRLDGHPAAPFGADRGDRPADRRDRLHSLRPHRRRDRHGGRGRGVRAAEPEPGRGSVGHDPPITRPPFPAPALVGLPTIHI